MGRDARGRGLKMNAATLEVGARPDMAGKMIVVILASFAERYLSSALFERL